MACTASITEVSHDLAGVLQRGPLGQIRFAGSRIDLYFVVAALQKGASVEQVAAQYPTLGPALVRSASEFYRQNRAAMDAYVQSVEAEIAHNLAPLGSSDQSILLWGERDAATDVQPPAVRALRIESPRA